MASPENTTIPPGSTVLVTGVNGLVGSHVANALLKHGYKVRGTVRDVQKSGWLVDFFEESFGSGVFELVEVGDMTTAGAFDEALKGVAGVAHVASPVSGAPDPNTIASGVASTLNILKSAASETSVKRFVLTSSIAAAAVAKPNERLVVAEESFNDEYVQLASNMPDDFSPVKQAFAIYASSKTTSERAVWDWVKQNRPDMVVNSVLPGSNFGTVLSPQNQGYPSSAALPHAVYNGDRDFVGIFTDFIPPSWCVDVHDTALLHVAALTREDVVGERIFALGSRYNVNDVLAAVRKMFPEREFMEDLPGLWDDGSVYEPVKRAEALLVGMGRSGFTPMEQSLKEAFEGF